MDAVNNYAQSSAVLMRMDNPPPAADLMKVTGVTAVDFISDKQARIFFEGSEEEISGRLIAASVTGGWRLIEINLDKGVLDEVFKQLSNK